MPQPATFNSRLGGRAAIVTGAGTDDVGAGIGFAIARVLAGEGAVVCAVDREIAKAEATCEAIARGGGQAFPVAADVTLDADCERIAYDCLDRVGRLDMLVNNVGVSMAVKLDDPVESGWDRVFTTNVKSAMLMTRYVVGPMAKGGGGAIVNISSIAGIRAHGAIAYGPSKAAMAALSREIAVAHGRQGIRVNTIAPGHLATPHALKVLPPEMREDRRRIGPLGVEGDAWDVALAVAFLCSDDARFITGVLLPVDGGVTEIGPMTAHALLTGNED